MHYRLGHLSFQRLTLLRDQLHLFCNKYKDSRLVQCDVCPLAKQKRLSFTSNNHTSPNPFDLVHCDTWGPYHVPIHSGYRYLLTLVDDCTGFTWVYLMRHKLDASCIIPKFFKMIETRFQMSFKKLSTNSFMWRDLNKIL